MQNQFKETHPSFRFQGVHYTYHDLNDMAYSLIKEGEKEERLIGDFLMDWVSPKDHVFLKTSGTTGRAKSISVSKQAMVNSALNTGEYFGIGANQTALLCLSGTHIAAKMILVRAMVLGLSLDTVDPTSSPLSAINKTYDLCAMVPLQLEKSIKHLSRVKTLLVGGAPLSSELREKLQSSSSKIFETYGMTETCSHIAVRAVNGSEAEFNEQLVNPFKTLPGITVSTDSRNCLVINAPDLDVDSLVTNDLVELISENEFRWLGRWDNIINSGGVKLIPETIENKLNPIIESRFTVLGKPDKKLGEKLVLVVEGEGDAAQILNKITDLDSLDQYEMPKEVHFIPKFELTKSGKLDRKILKEQFLT
ncbi:AMP-binding protein [Muriicola soli]|uniref:O-succinylbenzoic acid--CoA ligase n=1 Tax=Muriicola soli TaxID=2507538 RepID=A0A411E9C4_9FLAO|nr:AMP-binding protein [Muriicola soli]QBA64311.1 O-succinylbenzoic acid--CoA ligase [Muriicola soli]